MDEAVKEIVSGRVRGPVAQLVAEHADRDARNAAVAALRAVDLEGAHEKRQRDRGTHYLRQGHLGAGAAAKVDQAVVVHIPDVGVEGDR